MAAEAADASATTRPAEAAPGTQPARIGSGDPARPPVPRTAGAGDRRAPGAEGDFREGGRGGGRVAQPLPLEADTLSPTVVHVSHLTMEGGRAKARRMPDGTIQGMGLAFGPSPNPSKSSNPLAFLALLPKGFHARLDELSVRDMRAAFADEAVRPQADLAFAVEDFHDSRHRARPGPAGRAAGDRRAVLLAGRGQIDRGVRHGETLRGPQDRGDLGAGGWRPAGRDSAVPGPARRPVRPEGRLAHLRPRRRRLANPRRPLGRRTRGSDGSRSRTGRNCW